MAGLQTPLFSTPCDELRARIGSHQFAGLALTTHIQILITNSCHGFHVTFLRSVRTRGRLSDCSDEVQIMAYAIQECRHDETFGAAY